MTSTQHTPGPWTVASVSADTGNISIGHKDQRIVIAEVTNAASFGDMLMGAMKRGGGSFQQNDCRTQFANADLIAAAPDMLAALHRADRAIVELYRAACPHGNYVHGNNFADNCPEMGVIRAAIAKAEGRR